MNHLPEYLASDFDKGMWTRICDKLRACEERVLNAAVEWVEELARNLELSNRRMHRRDQWRAMSDHIPECFALLNDSTWDGYCVCTALRYDPDEKTILIELNRAIAAVDALREKKP